MKLEKFDYQIGNKRKKNTFIILGLICLGLFITIVLYKTFASYKVTNSYNIIGGKIADFTASTQTINMYLVAEDGSEMSTNTVPTEDEYVYDSTRSNCVNGTSLIYDETADTLTIDGQSSETCNAYFNYIPLAKQTLNRLNIAETFTSIPNYSDISNTQNGFYEANDNYGLSYYYYGLDRKYLDFAGYKWIIIRVNGDGSLRIMRTSENSSTSAYNTLSNDNAYVGFMYGTTLASIYDATHSNTNNSDILNALNNSYADISAYESYLSDAIFCNDRSLYKDEYGTSLIDDTKLGTGTSKTYYGAYYRLTNNKPSLICPNKTDSFTKNDESNGNGLLTNPVGLLTADEIYMTGLNYDPNLNIMSMSPWNFDGTSANIYYKKSSDNGNALSVSTISSYDIVVNLRNDLNYSGEGSSTSPYTIVE